MRVDEGRPRVVRVRPVQPLFLPGVLPALFDAFRLVQRLHAAIVLFHCARARAKPAPAPRSLKCRFARPARLPEQGYGSPSPRALRKKEAKTPAMPETRQSAVSSST